MTTQKLLPLHECAALLGVSETAFVKWNLTPVRRRGREQLYDWEEAREMAFRKRARRPGRGGGDVPRSAIDLAERFVRRADHAVKRKDLDELTALVRLSKELCLACGVDPHEAVS